MNLELNKIIKVALYTRVSTIQQVEEGFSLEAQKEHLLKYSDNNNYQVYKVYEELGRSGKNINRPAFQEMMQDMRNKKFDKIIVLKLDRISRSVVDLENIIQELQSNNCGFESASEKIDTTSAMGLMFIRLLGIFAQFERERISERIKDVFAEKIQRGLVITGSLPLGYKIGYNENNEKIVIKDLEKAEFVNAIFDKYEATSSLIKTCQYLNTTYPDFVYAGGFNTIDLKRIMLNTMYYGKLKDNDNYCEPYLTYERWKKINDMRESKNIKNNKRHVYLFSGIIKGACGHRLAGTHFISSRIHKTIKYSYRCSKYAHSGQCKNLNITEETIERKVLEMLPKTIDEFINNYEKEYVKTNVKDNSKKIKELESEKKRIIKSYNKGWMSESDAENEIDKINEKLKKYSEVPIKKDYSYLKELTNLNWIDYYKGLTRENKQLFFHKIIDLITVDVEAYRAGKENFIKIELVK